MAARCGLCLKTTCNNKQTLRLVTSDAEVKLQRGYYSLHQINLNQSLFNTKVHEKCYKKYKDRWYHEFVRKNRLIHVSSSFQDNSISINDENTVANEHDSTNICDKSNYDEDDNDCNSNLDVFCSTTICSSRITRQKNLSPFNDISNINHSPHTTFNCNSTDTIFPIEQILIHDDDWNNNIINNDSMIQNNTDIEHSSMFPDKEKSDRYAISLDKLDINFNNHKVSSTNANEATVSSDADQVELPFSSNSEFNTSVNQQLSKKQSPFRSIGRTSTPKIKSNKIMRRKKRRRHSEEAVLHSTGTNDRCLIFESPLHELHAWLRSILNDGRLIPLTNVQHQYNMIRKTYEHHEEDMNSSIRCDVIRKQIESQFPNYYHFETVNKRDGTYIALNNISFYSRTAINTSKSSSRNFSDCQQQAITTATPSSLSQITNCETVFTVVRLLRNHIKDTLHVLETLFKEPEKLTELTNDLFADCVPLVIRNFIGLLTASNRHFKKLENEHDYYDFFDKDIFGTSSKSLKNTVIGHDILNARHDHIVSPKHILLANEISKHARSNELLCILNRFGHTASYKTISRINRKIANKQMIESSLPSSVLPNCYLVQVADNFDLNRETLHGELIINNNNKDLLRDSPLSFNDITIDNPSESEALSYNVDQATCESAVIQNEKETSMNKIRIAGFMAIHLPHTIKPRHKVTFMSPLNEDPNKLETAELCMTDMKKKLMESGFQKDAILVVDEKIFRLCMEDKNTLEFEGIFLYPGDFHMMKCAMVVIWDILQGSGIDDLIGELYKGATYRAVLAVANFNKSLRTIKLLYTALSIIINNEFILTLPVEIFDEMEVCMNKIPTDLNNPEQSRKWYQIILDFLSKSKWQECFHKWIQDNCYKNLKFRFWSFVLFDLITPLIKLYTALRTGDFVARNAAVCELSELFFASNHRQYARLTARHISDLRVCPQHLLDYLSKSFAVSRSNRNFSSIALDQTIEVTINKAGKGHGGVTGRCSIDLIDIWSNSFAYRSLLSTITSELAAVESSSNSVESHIECSPTRMQADHIDLQIILDKLIEEKMFSCNTSNVTQIFTGKIIHPDIIESNCQSRKIGAEALEVFIRERLVGCSVPVNKPLHASSLLYIRDNDTYESTGSGVHKRSKKNSIVDIKKIDAEIRRVVLIAQYRPVDLVAVFGHEFSTVPISLCSLEDPNLLNQQSKSKDTLDFLRDKFPSAISSTCLQTLNKQQALVIDGSSLLHIYPRAGSTVYEHATYLLIETILPVFADFSRIDIVFDSPRSRDLKSFINRHSDKNLIQPKYDFIPRNSHLQTGKAYQNFVISNRTRFAAIIIECWKENQLIQQLPLGSVLVIAGPNEKATKLERDKPPVDVIELESNQIEADSRMILHIDQLIQNSFFNITVKSIDTDVIILCIYYASLLNLEKLIVDATVPKKTPKFIDCTYINNELIDKCGVDPILLLIVYALSGCDTCSFIRNISKRTFMLVLFDSPNEFNDLKKLTVLPVNHDDIAGAERLFVRCFSSNRRHRSSSSISGAKTLAQTNQNDISLNELRAAIAMTSLKQNKSSIVTSLPPTNDALFHHCLRVSRQVQIWLQAPDGYITYPAFEDSGFQVINNFLHVKWTSKLPFSNDRQLSCCGKHKGNCTRCVCILNQLPCTLFCQCPIDCPNRRLNPNEMCNTQKATTDKQKFVSRHSSFTTGLLDLDYSSEENSDSSSISNENCVD
ncbi:unnamed protein product, partial [Rotaria sp. Silwood2]